jgi:hypothetical protein
MTRIRFNNARDRDDLIDIVISPVEFSEGTIGLLLPPVTFADPEAAFDGVQIYPLRDGENIGELYVRTGDKADPNWEVALRQVDRTRLYEFSSTAVSALRGIRIARGAALQGIFTLRGSRHVPTGQTQQFSVIQLQGGDIVGGSTYMLRLNRARKLLPVSRIRIVLEKARILDDHEPWFKGRGEFSFATSVTFNRERCRRHVARVPERGVLKISDKPGTNELHLNVCVFDGLVSETDRMQVGILPVEQDWLDPDDRLGRYHREFDGPPESWVGSYTPDDEPPAVDPERTKDWLVWYRIESVPI